MPCVTGQGLPILELDGGHVATGDKRQFDQLGEIYVVLVVAGQAVDAGLNIEFEAVCAAARRGQLLRHVRQLDARACGFLLVSIEQRNEPASLVVKTGVDQCLIYGLVERSLVESGFIALRNVGDLSSRSDGDTAVDDLVEHARIFVTKRVKRAAAVCGRIHLRRTLSGARVERGREVVKPHEVSRVHRGIRCGNCREHPAPAALVDEVRVDGARTDEEAARR